MLRIWKRSAQWVTMAQTRGASGVAAGQKEEEEAQSS